MAYLEQFTIHGLAGHAKPVHRVLDRHINIFWGLNGTGKTSLLKILHGALRNEASFLERVPFDSAEVQFFSVAHGASIMRTLSKDPNDNSAEDDSTGIETSLESIGDGLWREKSMERRKIWTTEVLTKQPRTTVSRPDVAFRHSYLPISRMNQVGLAQPYRSAQRASIIDEEFLDDDFADQVRRKWQAYNAEALASIRSIQQQGLASILAQLFGGGTGTPQVTSEEIMGSEAYALVQGFLREQGISLTFGQNEFLRRYEEQTDLRTVVANIQDVTREVEEALRAQHDFQDVIQNLYSGGKELLFEVGRAARGSLRIEAHGTSIPLQSLSSGEKQLLRLMLETLAAEEDTVMIDEPELSMHVDWQQVLVASMRRVNPDCQLLLATHSPEVMADVPDEFVFEL